MAKKDILIFFLLLTTVTGGILLFQGKTFSENYKNPYPFLDIARNFISQEHFIVNLQPIREELNNIVAIDGPDTISLYFEYLNTGANISINPDLKIWPASLAKLPLALAVMKKIDNGVWELDNELVLMEGDKETGSGLVYKNPTGTRFTIENLLKELLINSDNTAYKILLRNMSASELQPIIEETGLDDFFDKDGGVSAKEYSRLFRTLYTSSFLKRENSSKVLEWLSESKFDKHLMGGMDKKVKFAHKWGVNEDFHAFADSGIVYMPNRPYIITVMIKGDKSAEEAVKVQETMKKVSSIIYNYVTSYTN